MQHCLFSNELHQTQAHRGSEDAGLAIFQQPSIYKGSLAASSQVLPKTELGASFLKEGAQGTVWNRGERVAHLRFFYRPGL